MRSAQIGTAYETNIAMPLLRPKTRVIGPAIEIDEALPMRAIGGAALAALIISLPKPDLYPPPDGDLVADFTAAGLEFATLVVAVAFCLRQLRSHARRDASP